MGAEQRRHAASALSEGPALTRVAVRAFFHYEYEKTKLGKPAHLPRKSAKMYKYVIGVFTNPSSFCNVSVSLATCPSRVAGAADSPAKDLLVKEWFQVSGYALTSTSWYPCSANWSKACWYDPELIRWRATQAGPVFFSQMAA